ncbi:hypothetical protein XBJ2_1890002 [Xenorhabdus bovienii str. Jollieti]|nr:hypothetical protein XBJ2_1890002 [Xenorhabdus bovienii str. Jollieti]
MGGLPSHSGHKIKLELQLDTGWANKDNRNHRKPHPSKHHGAPQFTAH